MAQRVFSVLVALAGSAWYSAKALSNFCREASVAERLIMFFVAMIASITFSSVMVSVVVAVVELPSLLAVNNMVGPAPVKATINQIAKAPIISPSTREMVKINLEVQL